MLTNTQFDTHTNNTKMKDLTEEIYAALLEEYKESGYELYDEMFLTQFTYVGGYQWIHQN